LILNELLLAGEEIRRRISRWLALALLGILVGMLRATNTWDWITYLLLGGVGLAVAWWLSWRRIDRRSLIDAAGRIGAFLAISVVAVMPYTAWFATDYTRILPWWDGKTPLWGYLDIHGLYLFLLVSLLIWDTARFLRSTQVRDLRGTWALILGGLLIWVILLVVSFVLALREYQVTLIVVPLLLWIGALFLRRGQSRAMQFILLIAGLALGLTLGVEYVVLDGDIGRQNTIFKFYIQAWLLFSVVGGAALAWLIAGLDQWKPALRGTWSVALTVLFAVSALFFLTAAQGKAMFRFDQNQPLTLDGAAFMNYASQWEGADHVLAVNPSVAPFALAEDYALIRWLQENVEGTPTIVEGLADSTQYRWNGRISIYTGLPAVMGWHFHQWQQRTMEWQRQFVDKRYANVVAFYHSDSIDYAWQFLQHYDVEYVIVGVVERAYYLPERLAKFDRMVEQGMLEVAFRQGSSTIYRVVENAAPIERG
jgi:YYY domain-containing protein